MITHSSVCGKCAKNNLNIAGSRWVFGIPGFLEWSVNSCSWILYLVITFRTELKKAENKEEHFPNNGNLG